jgi:hypothetical protein
MAIFGDSYPSSFNRGTFSFLPSRQGVSFFPVLSLGAIMELSDSVGRPVKVFRRITFILSSSKLPAKRE